MISYKHQLIKDSKLVTLFSIGIKNLPLVVVFRQEFFFFFSTRFMEAV